MSPARRVAKSIQRAKANARQAAYKARQRVVRIDDLAVTCYCEAEIVHVPRAVILEGRTETCGREGCEAA